MQTTGRRIRHARGLALVAVPVLAVLATAGAWAAADARADRRIDRDITVARDARATLEMLLDAANETEADVFA